MTMKKHNKYSKFFLLSAVIILSSFCMFGCGNEENENALDDMAEGENTSDDMGEEKNAIDNMALLDIMDKIYEITPVDLSIYSDNMDVTDSDTMFYNAGLTNLNNVKEAAVSEPMMSSQAYSMVLVRANDESATATIANEMKAGINPAKWVCVAADDLQIVSYRDVILLFMVSSELSDTVTSQEIVDAFQQVCGDAELVSY